MKKHISVLELLARSSIYKIIFCFAVMAAARCLTFTVWIESNGLACILFLAELVLVSFLLCRTGQDLGGHQSYTLQRLGIAEKAVFFWQIGYNLVIYLTFWGLQLITAYLLCRFRLPLPTSSDTINGVPDSQLLFLTFARSEYLHTLMPASELLAWLRNLLYFTALAVTAAWYPVGKNRGSKVYNYNFYLVGFAGTLLIQDTGEVLFSALAIVLSLSQISHAMHHFLKKEADNP